MSALERIAEREAADREIAELIEADRRLTAVEERLELLEAVVQAMRSGTPDEVAGATQAWLRHRHGVPPPAPVLRGVPDLTST